VLSGLFIGGSLTMLEKNLPSHFHYIIGGFIFLTAVSFILIDWRIRSLLKLSISGLKKFEGEMIHDESKLFHRDSGKSPRFALTFNLLFSMVGLYGLGLIYCVSQGQVSP